MLSSYISEIRWIPLDSEALALVHRSWMDGEAESSVDWADMTANFYLGFIYSTEAGTDTIAASWAAIQALGDVSLPEDILKNQAIDGLRQNGVDLEAGSPTMQSTRLTNPISFDITRRRLTIVHHIDQTTSAVGRPIHVYG